MHFFAKYIKLGFKVPSPALKCWGGSVGGAETTPTLGKVSASLRNASDTYSITPECVEYFMYNVSHHHEAKLTGYMQTALALACSSELCLCKTQ